MIVFFSILKCVLKLYVILFLNLHLNVCIIFCVYACTCVSPPNCTSWPRCPLRESGLAVLGLATGPDRPSAFFRATRALLRLMDDRAFHSWKEELVALWRGGVYKKSLKTMFPLKKNLLYYKKAFVEEHC